MAGGAAVTKCQSVQQRHRVGDPGQPAARLPSCLGVARGMVGPHLGIPKFTGLSLSKLDSDQPSQTRALAGRRFPACGPPSRAQMAT
jgi:hypothetical protein